MNIALGRPSFQSSIWHDYSSGSCQSGRAVDGNFDTDLTQGSCSQTNDGPSGENWWMVDLGQPVNVGSVVVTNRGDAPVCVNRLDYFIVGVTNSSSPPQRGCYALCGQYPRPAVTGAAHNVDCSPSVGSGRYVVIQQPIDGAGSLTLCEVEVYARSVTDTGLWAKVSSQRLLTNGSYILKKRSTVECIRECKNQFGCESINFSPVNRSCELNFLPRGAVACDLILASGWNWWNRIFRFVD